jgi:hypothetical protein
VASISGEVGSVKNAAPAHQGDPRDIRARDRSNGQLRDLLQVELEGLEEPIWDTSSSG